MINKYNFMHVRSYSKLFSEHACVATYETLFVLNTTCGCLYSYIRLARASIMRHTHFQIKRFRFGGK